MKARPDAAIHTYEKNAEVSDFSPYEFGHHGDVMTHKNISSPNIDESKLKVRISIASSGLPLWGRVVGGTDICPVIHEYIVLGKALSFYL